MRNKIQWSRVNARPTIATSFDKLNGGYIELDMLGIEMVTDYPLYDNGEYVVVDTVKDLQFHVLHFDSNASRWVRMSMKPYLNKYEAIEYADDLLEADKRYIDEAP